MKSSPLLTTAALSVPPTRLSDCPAGIVTVAGGTVTIPAGQSLNLVGGTLSAAVVNNGLLFIQGVVTLSGALTTGASSILRVQGNSTFGGGALTVTTGFTNTATIELTDIVSSYGASLTVTTGTLTNAPGATI